MRTREEILTRYEGPIASKTNAPFWAIAEALLDIRDLLTKKEDNNN